MAVGIPQRPYPGIGNPNYFFNPGDQATGNTYTGPPRTNDYFFNPGGQSQPNSSNNSNGYGSYNAAITQNAGDYDEIMKRYRDFLNGAPNVNQPQRFQPQSYTPQTPLARQSYSPQSFTPTAAPRQLESGGNITPQSVNYNPGIAPSQMTVTGATYQQDPNVTSALSKLQGLATTGGYTPQDIADLRERGISPIRSIYANAQRNIDRQRALTGGYSPNYGAVTSKMTRELADQLGNATTNVNAGIAQNVAANKLSAAPAYASAAGAESAIQNQIERENAAAKMRVGEFNTSATNDWSRRNAEGAFQAAIANASAADEANKFNINNRLNVNRYNVEGANEASRYNTMGTNEVNRLNALGINDVNRLNTEGINTANRENWLGANDINRYNATGANETNRFNAGLASNDRAQQLQAMQGMLGLYGTTPGLANMFGNQALNQAQLQNLINQQNKNYGSGLLGMFR